MRNDTYGFAIVGCGVISSFHARSIATIPNARLRAVMDAVPERAERFAAELGVDGYTNLAEMLDRPDVDVVCICVPSGRSRLPARRARRTHPLTAAFRN